jgi:ribosome-binding protein aMBF1 (putative translation factor)
MSVLDEIVATITTEELTQTVRRMGIPVLIVDTFEAKGWTKADFAKKMGRKMADIHYLLSGTYNFTIAELTEIEFVLDTKLFFSKELDWTPNLVGKHTYSTIEEPLLEAAEPKVGYSTPLSKL